MKSLILQGTKVEQDKYKVSILVLITNQEFKSHMLMYLILAHDRTKQKLAEMRKEAKRGFSIKASSLCANMVKLSPYCAEDQRRGSLWLKNAS